MLSTMWSINVILALIFAGAGAMKLLRSKQQLSVSPGMGWTDGYSATTIKVIGAAEIAGALGLVLPMASNIAPLLTPLASCGLVIVMTGAVATHARRQENVTTPLLLGVLALISAVIGFIVVLG